MILYSSSSNRHWGNINDKKIFLNRDDNLTNDTIFIGTILQAIILSSHLRLFTYPVINHKSAIPRSQRSYFNYFIEPLLNYVQKTSDAGVCLRLADTAIPVRQRK